MLLILDPLDPLQDPVDDDEEGSSDVARREEEERMKEAAVKETNKLEERDAVLRGTQRRTADVTPPLTDCRATVDVKNNVEKGILSPITPAEPGGRFVVGFAT